MAQNFSYPRIPVGELFPVVEGGKLPAKATVGEPFPISATVFREGHDAFAAEAVLLRPTGAEHMRIPMTEIAPGLDRLEAWVCPNKPGHWSFAVDTWSDAYTTWRRNASIKIVVATFALGVFSLLLAVMPTYRSFTIMTIPVGLCVLTLLTSANQTVQMTTEPAMRGRVLSIYMMFFLGSTPVGAPLIGWVADAWGPRIAIATGGLSAVLAALVAAAWSYRHWNLSLHYSSTRPYLRAAPRTPETPPQAPEPESSE